MARKGEPLLNAIPPLEMGVSLAHAAANLGITLTPEVEEFGRQFEALMQTERRGPCGSMALQDQPQQTEAKQASNPFAYRRGLPSVEDVRAHAERGGWWQAQRPKGLQMLRLYIKKCLVHGQGEIDMVCAAMMDTDFGAQEPENFGKSLLRPVSYPEGDPIPWPSAVDGAEAKS